MLNTLRDKLKCILQFYLSSSLNLTFNILPKHFHQCDPYNYHNLFSSTEGLVEGTSRVLSKKIMLRFDILSMLARSFFSLTPGAYFFQLITEQDKKHSFFIDMFLLGNSMANNNKTKYREMATQRWYLTGSLYTTGNALVYLAMATWTWQSLPNGSDALQRLAFSSSSQKSGPISSRRAGNANSVYRIVGGVNRNRHPFRNATLATVDEKSVEKRWLKATYTTGSVCK